MHPMSDHPGRASPLLSAISVWSRTPKAELAPEARRVWEGFGTGDDPWLAGVAAGAEPWPPLVIIDDAPDSQFDRAVRMLQAGTDLPDGLICLALAGSGFRGQRGRPWTALRGNLHLTAHYRLDVPADRAAALTALPAVAVAEAIEAVGGETARPGIKWVNDVLLGGRKVAGVLTSTQVQGRRIRHAVLGIGINVARAPDGVAGPGTVPPTSLADADPALGASLPRVFREVVRRMEQGIRDVRTGRGEVWIGRYRARSLVIGREVEIWPEGAEAPGSRPLGVGRVTDLLPDLALRIEGVPEPVRRGRVTLRP